MIETSGAAYRTTIDDLLLIVEKTIVGWGYGIYRNELEELAQWVPVMPQDEHENGVKLAAVSKALELLQRTDNPATVLLGLNWTPTLPGRIFMRPSQR